MTTAAGILPNEYEAERALLYSILIEPTVLDQIELDAADFYTNAHRVIFEAMQRVWDRGEPIDYVFLSDELIAMGKEHEVPAGTLHDMAGATSVMYFYSPHYVNKIRKAAELRRYISFSQNLVRQAFEPGANPEQLHAMMHEQLVAINLGKGKRDALLTWEESHELTEQILLNQGRKTDAERMAWAWPWASWNKLLNPLEAGMLAVLAAGDGQGKTVYAECIAEYWASKGHQVCFFHFELNREFMMKRRLCRNARLDMYTINNNMIPDDYHRVKAAREKLEAYPGKVHYIKCEGWTMDQVIREASRMRELGMCDAIVVDYIEKAGMSNSQRKQYGRDGYDRRADDVEQLKIFSESKGIRVLALMQFNKLGKQSDGIDRNAIRGAGEKTEKANVVVLLKRDKVDGGEIGAGGKVLVEPGGYSRTVEVFIDKNSGGKTGQLAQFFAGEYYDVRELESHAI